MLIVSWRCAIQHFYHLLKLKIFSVISLLHTNGCAIYYCKGKIRLSLPIN